MQLSSVQLFVRSPVIKKIQAAALYILLALPKFPCCHRVFGDLSVALLYRIY